MNLQVRDYADVCDFWAVAMIWRSAGGGKVSGEGAMPSELAAVDDVKAIKVKLIL